MRLNFVNKSEKEGGTKHVHITTYWPRDFVMGQLCSAKGIWY